MASLAEWRKKEQEKLKQQLEQIYAPAYESKEKVEKQIASFDDLVNDIINSELTRAQLQKIQQTPGVAPVVEQQFPGMVQNILAMQPAGAGYDTSIQRQIARQAAQAARQRGLSTDITPRMQDIARAYYQAQVAQQRPMEMQMEQKVKGAAIGMGRGLYEQQAEAARQNLIAQIATTSAYMDAKNRLAQLIADKYGIDKGVANQIADMQLRSELSYSQWLSNVIGGLTQTAGTGILYYAMGANKANNSMGGK